MDKMTQTLSAPAPPGGNTIHATTNGYEDARVRVQETSDGEIAVYVYRPLKHNDMHEYLIGGDMWLRRPDGIPEPLIVMARPVYDAMARAMRQQPVEFPF